MQIWLDRNRAKIIVPICERKSYPVQFSCRRKSYPVQCEHSVRCAVTWIIGEKRAHASQFQKLHPSSSSSSSSSSPPPPPPPHNFFKHILHTSLRTRFWRGRAGHNGRRESSLANVLVDCVLSPYYLRDSRASEARARVKISPPHLAFSRVG